MNRTPRSVIDSFFKEKRFAMVGVSRNPLHFSRALLRDFLKRGYDVAPVNPGVDSIDGRPCFAAVGAVEPNVTAALIITNAKRSAELVEQCAAVGVKKVWLYRSVAMGSVSPEAVTACERHGMEVVTGHCPYMFLPDSGWIHSIHRGFLSITGRLPV
jgi:hypothetical protein